MKNTKGLPFIYHVGSDIETSAFFAEFEKEADAIAFAKRNMDKLPFVQKITLEYDENGFETAVDYIDIWDHTMADTNYTSKSEDNYWDKLAADEQERIENEPDLGDTTWFESVDPDNLVETMEENEDMVECKECFDLFPKADCVKLDIGYICPTCADAGKLISVSDKDIFDIDFPEYKKCNCEDGTTSIELVDTEKEPADKPSLLTKEILDQVEVEGSTDSVNEPELAPEEAVPFLVKDEEEAVAGYEQAAEVVADSDLENKEEILDTIDHIKKEEEEHIEELQDLVDNETTDVENEPISDEAKEVEETAVDVEESEVKSLTERLNVTKDSFKAELDAALEKDGHLLVFYGDPREFGVRSRDYYISEGSDSGYTLDYEDYTYMDDFTGLEECESFYCYDDLWDYLVDWAAAGTDFSSDYNFISDPLVEHVNKECSPIESDQELEGTDNAVVDCKVAKVVAHSEDEKPVDCEGKKKPLEKPLTESFVGVLNKDTEADCGEFYRLCKEIGIETVSDLKRFNDEEAWRDGHLLDKLRAYRDELGDDFQIKESVNSYKFTKEEQEEFNMDENGVSLDSYDEYVRCNWCNEIFTKDSCVFEADLGWLCDRCYEAILSRGESLTIIKYPTDEDIAKTLTEDVEDEEVLSSDPAEKPSKNVKMANTASTSGMDFETACKMFGVELEN